MSNYSREEALLIAAERLRRKEEEEKLKENQYYEKITTGKPWFLFKIVVAFCTLMIVITTIEIYVDGETKKLTENEWKIDRELYLFGHQSVKVGDYLFAPPLKKWFGHVDNSFNITYTPIFGTGKRLSYDLEINEYTTIRSDTIRQRSIFTWFPFLQIIMLIPLLTFFYKRQKPLFNFARVASIVIVFPGTLMITILTLL